MDKMKDVALLAGRVLLALMFVMAGWGKIGGYAGTQGYMEAMGVPGFMLPLVILLELVVVWRWSTACLPASSPYCWPVLL